MTWTDYVNQYLNSENPEYSGIFFGVNGLDHHEPSFFVRLNANLSTDFDIYENKRRIFVYPASQNFVVSLVVFKTINEALSGYLPTAKIGPADIDPGQLFHLGKAVCRCVKKTKEGSDDYMWFCGTVANKTRGFPFSSFPPLELASKGEKLSPTKFVDEEKNRVMNRAANQDNLSLTEKISMLRPLVGQTSILITQDSHIIGALPDFTVNNAKLIDIMSISKCWYDGKLLKVEGGISAANPQILVAPNIPSAYLAYSDNKLNLSSIYVDLRGIKSIGDYLDDIDGLSESGAQITFFNPSNSSVDCSGLVSRGYKQFQWTNKMITNEMIVQDECNDGSRLLSSFTRLTISPMVIKDDTLSSILTELLSYQEENDSLPRQMNDVLTKLITVMFRLLRQCVALPDNELTAMSTRTDSLVNEMMDETNFSHYSNQHLAKRLSDLWAVMKAKAEDKNPPKQNEICTTILGDHYFNNKRVLVVVDGSADEKYVQSKLTTFQYQNTSNNTTIVAQNFDNFINDETNYDSIIVCGWFGKEKMKSIFFSNRAISFIPVLFGCELSWLQSTLSKWSRDIQYSGVDQLDCEIEPIEASCLSINTKWLSEPKEEVPDHDYEETIHRTQKNKWHGYTEMVEGDTLSEGRQVSFSDGSFGVFSKGYSFVRFPDNENEGLREVSANDIAIGDIVLFMDSNHNILVDDATKILLEEDQEDALEKATYWKMTFIMAKNSGLSQDEIIAKLKAAEIDRCDSEFKIWMDGDSDIICPRSPDVLIKIGTALGDDELVQEANSIVEKARIVWSARIRAGKRLCKKLIENIEVVTKISKLKQANEFSNESINVNMNGIGKVEIVSVIETGDYDQFPTRLINQRKPF